MSLAKVSVVIPVYNSADYLVECVNSVLPLDEVGEIILVDDGSSDNSFLVCKDLSLLNSKVKVFHHSDNLNLGVSCSRNLGINKASLPYIAFLDSDDYYLPNRFHDSIKLLDEDSNLDACFGVVLKVNQTNGERKAFGFLKRTERDSVFRYLLKGGYFHTNSVLVRKSFLDDFGYFDSELKIHEDVELWIRMAYFGRIRPILSTEPLAVYNDRFGSLIKKASSKTKFLLWKKVSLNFFFRPIGFKNRYLILKQLYKGFLLTLK